MKFIRTALYVAVALAASVLSVYGQTVTTGTITGLVQDLQGGVLPGVTVTAIHVPTGASYEATSQGDAAGLQKARKAIAAMSKSCENTSQPRRRP